MELNLSDLEISTITKEVIQEQIDKQNQSLPDDKKISPENITELSVIGNRREIAADAFKNFKNLQVNEKVYLNFFLDNELFPSYFKYLGKEIIQTKFGKFKAIKIAPLLVKGSMFEGGEHMTIWVTDDENHIPIRIETPIIVGSIKVDMKSYEGLRYPLSSLIEVE